MKRVSTKTIIIWAVIIVAILCILGVPLGKWFADALILPFKGLIIAFKYVINFLNYVKKLAFLASFRL